MKKILVIAVLILLGGIHSKGQKMTVSKMGKIITSVSDTVAGKDGYWQFAFRKLPMLCVSDKKHNRMRIVVPVKKIEEVTNEQFVNCMEANYHTALDVKYAFSDGLLWVVYIHPLEELEPDQLKDAIEQVYNAVLTFGYSYTSTELTFPKRE